MFTQQFDSYVCEHDEIQCEVGPYTVMAMVVYDPDSSPSDYDAPGCCFDTSDPDHGEENQAIIEAWRNDEWFYCGIVMSVEHRDSGVLLVNQGASLWGIECNFPGADNTYLRDVANELLQEAIDEAKGKLESIKDSL